MNMGISKTDHFSDKQVSLAKYAKALGHPARIAIMNLLIKRKTCFCGDIVDYLPLAQSTVSQHLTELKEAGLIRGTVAGAAVCYCINEKEWNRAKSLLVQFMSSANLAKIDCCK